MAIARVGTGSGKQNIAGATSKVITYSFTAGNLGVVAGAFSANTTVTVADSSATGWTVLTQSDSGPNVAFVAYRANMPAGITSVTISCTGSAFGAAAADEFSGVATSSPQDGSAVLATNNGPVNTLASGNLTASQAGDLIVGAASADDGSNVAWNTTLGSWTQIFQEPDTTTSHAAQTAFQVGSGTGPFALTWSYPPGDSQMSSVLVAFKATGSTTTGTLKKAGPGVSPSKLFAFRQTLVPGQTVPSLVIALTGNSATGSVGTLNATSTNTIGALKRPGPGVSPFNNTQFLSGPRSGPTAPSSNVSVALSGVTGTGSTGTLTPSDSAPLTATTSTGSVGTVTPALSVAVVGVSGTGSVGTLIPALSIGLTGSTGTGSAGTLAPATVVSLSGVTGTGSVGSVSAASPGSAALTGVTGTGSVGTVLPSSVVAQTGISATGSAGTVGPANTDGATGNTGTGSAGTTGVSTVVALSGTTGTGSAGTVSVQSSDVTLALSGVSAAGSVGSVAASGGNAASTGGGSYGGRQKQKYIVKHGDQLLVFTDKQSAIAVLTAQASPKKKQKPLPKPDEAVSVPVIKEMTETRGQIDQFTTDLDSKRYEALVALFEQMRDEEEIELLLLHDH